MKKDFESTALQGSWRPQVFSENEIGSQLEALFPERDVTVLTAWVEAALLAGVEPVTPPPLSLREPPVAQTLAALFDLPLERAEEVLTNLHDTQAWVEGAGRKVRVLHVKSPLAGSATLVRVEPGGEFPDHGHSSDETVLVLVGAYRDSNGEERRTGQVHVSVPGTEHSLEPVGGVACICAVFRAAA